MKFLQKNKPLYPYSTFGIGGTAKWFATVSTIGELAEVFAFCREKNEPFLMIGKGSNSLFPDEGYNGVAILNKISFLDIDQESVHAGSGYNFSLLGVKTARKGLSGLEFASGIPATVGGAVFMNAGANGKETKDPLEAVEFLHFDGTLNVFEKKELSFSYRHSSFHQMKGAIVSARFTLQLLESAREDQLKILETRLKTQPYGDKSCGCVFRNPTGHHAGALIEQCGLKGKRVGGAEVSPLHANFIVNRKGATAKDVLKLASQIKECVKEKTGIDLEMELKSLET